MPIFSTRSSKREAGSVPKHNVPVDSIETLRTRARQRLIGSAILVVLGIVTFTLLFDSQPRPIPVDIPIIIPDKDKQDVVNVPVAPDLSSISPTTAKVQVPVTTSSSSPVQASASLGDKEEIVVSKTDKKVDIKTDIKQDAKLETRADTKQEVKTESKSVSNSEVKLEPKSDTKQGLKPGIKPDAVAEAAKALAILEGKEPPKTVAKTSDASAAAAAERFVVQVGAFAENDKARAARLKLEGAGLKTYVHVAETPQGKRIRVRVGPFVTRVEAEKAATKIKVLDLPAAILTL